MRLIRGRSMKSSSGSTSCQNASTSFTLVKKRWPPMSNRQPSRSTVRLIPPTTESASRTVEVMPYRVTSSYAAVSPAGPAPMITTFGGSGAGAGGAGASVMGCAAAYPPVPSGPFAPEGDPQLDQVGHGPGDPPGDGAPRRPQLLHHDGHLAGAQSRPLGPQDELGVEQVGAELARLGEGDQRLAPQDLHPVGVGHAQAEADLQDGGEDQGDHAPGPRSGVQRPFAPLGADHLRRPARAVHERHR